MFSHAPLDPGSCRSYSLPQPPAERYVAISYVGQSSKLLVFCLDSTPQLPGKSQVCYPTIVTWQQQCRPAHYRRGLCVLSFLSSSLALILLLLLLLPCSLPSLLPSLHVVITCPGFATLSLSLPFYNKCLKTMNCLFSLGPAVLEQWSRSSSKELLLISLRRPPCASRHGLHQPKPPARSSQRLSYPREPAQCSPPALFPRLELACGPTLCSQLFHGFQWRLQCPRVRTCCPWLT